MIDITVNELKAIIRKNIPFASPDPKKDGDNDIGGLELAREVTMLSLKTIYQLTSQRKIPFFKKGKILYFSCRAATYIQKR